MLDIDTLSMGKGRGGVNVYSVCIIISTVVVLAGNARAEAGRAGGAGRRGRVTIPLSGDGLGGGRTWPGWTPADMDKRCYVWQCLETTATVFSIRLLYNTHREANSTNTLSLPTLLKKSCGKVAQLQVTVTCSNASLEEEEAAVAASL